MNHQSAWSGISDSWHERVSDQVQVKILELHNDSGETSEWDSAIWSNSRIAHPRRCSLVGRFIGR